MEQWIRGLSKGTLAFLVIGGGIFFIIASDPPHTICDAHLEQFNELQVGFLYIHKKYKKFKKKNEYMNQVDKCKWANSSGGCYELFKGLKQLKRDLDKVPQECYSDISGLKLVKKSLWDSVELFVQLAWGEAPPETYNEKFGWLDAADMKLFCDLKEKVMKYYGASQWNNFREKIMKELPGAETISREKVWEKIILSSKCQAY